ncbi:hypothetical protein PF010_g31137, partial [Phytophthora fragariae]
WQKLQGATAFRS